MKSKIFRDIVIFFALVSLASDCNKEDHDPPEGFDTLIVKKISVTPETGNTNTEFKFIAEWMVSFEDPLIMCRWDFNYTGEEDIFWDTDWGANEITHTFESKGDYIIFVEAKNGVIGHDVEHALKSTNLTVSLPDNTPPLASFTVNPDIGFPNESFTVDASSSLDVEDPIEMLQVRWDWEDDGTYDTEYTTEKLADHAYQEPGNYTIKLQVKDTEELTGEKTLDVIVEVPGGNPCPGVPTVTDVDGNEYPTVLIGDQCWMKENLKTTKYNDGLPIPNVTDNIEWYWLTTGAYVWYENDNTWKEKYGAMYNWTAVDNPGGLCPTGWHVPTFNELTELRDYIGGTNSTGKKLNPADR